MLESPKTCLQFCAALKKAQTTALSRVKPTVKMSFTKKVFPVNLTSKFDSSANLKNQNIIRGILN